MASSPPIDVCYLVTPYPEARPPGLEVGRLSLALLKGQPTALHLFTG